MWEHYYCMIFIKLHCKHDRTLMLTPLSCACNDLMLACYECLPVNVYTKSHTNLLKTHKHTEVVTALRCWVFIMIWTLWNLHILIRERKSQYLKTVSWVIIRQPDTETMVWGYIMKWSVSSYVSGGISTRKSMKWSNHSVNRQNEG